MADYKDILTGTFGKLADRVKDAADSSGVAGVYARGADRAKAFGQLTRLTLALNGELTELNRVYTEIGRLYYDQAKSAPEGFFVPLFEQAGRLTAAISAKESEIAGLKSAYLESSEKAGDSSLSDFDDVVSAAERDAMGDSGRPE